MQKFYEDHELVEFIAINEVNSGFSDHVDFKKTIDILFKKLIDILYDNKDKSFSELDSWDKSFVHIIKFFGYGDTIPHTVTRKKLTIKLQDVIVNDKTRDFVILGGGAYLQDGKFEIRIDINEECDMSDLISHKDKLEEILSHELVHVFKHLHGSYQKSIKDYKKDSENDEDYWTNQHEVDAYITQTNTQLKNIKNKDQSIKYSEAIRLTDGYKQLKRHIPINKRKIINRFLSKTSNYWKSLGGRINEFKIKLK